MSFLPILAVMLLWGALTGIALGLFAVAQHASGFASELERARSEGAADVERFRAIGARLALISIGMQLVLSVAAIVTTRIVAAVELAFVVRWAAGFGVLVIGQFVDLFLVDFLLLLKLKPAFMKIPDTEYYRSGAPHIRAFNKALGLGLPVSLVATGLSYIFTL